VSPGVGAFSAARVGPDSKIRASNGTREVFMFIIRMSLAGCSMGAG